MTCLNFYLEVPSWEDYESHFYLPSSVDGRILFVPSPRDQPIIVGTNSDGSMDIDNFFTNATKSTNFCKGYFKST
eukprot:UN07098